MLGPHHALAGQHQPHQHFLILDQCGGAPRQLLQQLLAEHHAVAAQIATQAGLAAGQFFQTVLYHRVHIVQSCKQAVVPVVHADMALHHGRTRVQLAGNLPEERRMHNVVRVKKSDGVNARILLNAQPIQAVRQTRGLAARPALTFQAAVAGSTHACGGTVGATIGDHHDTQLFRRVLHGVQGGQQLIDHRLLIVGRYQHGKPDVLVAATRGRRTQAPACPSGLIGKRQCQRRQQQQRGQGRAVLEHRHQGAHEPLRAWGAAGAARLT